jgi:CHAT domain-containing protein
LYQQLFAPLREALVGVTHQLVVPDDVLLPLPFGVLITDASGNAYAQLATLYRHRQRRAPTPAELATYADVAWLAKDYALTVLPSATALRTLRHLPRPSVPAHEPLVGFGDPVLVGTTACSQHRDIMLPTRRTDTTLEAVRHLCPLPHTRAELHAMAQALGADPAQALYVGAQATRPMVHALNQSGRLGTAQVLAFSTHGLIAGAVTKGSQPALVLTPPVSASAEDDGLLSLDEIVQLALPATEWVILSACNTAAADGSGEGLSGLVRAFFFAGAPALLVSHWSVDVQATAALMTAIFRYYGDAPERSRAEALRQGMLAMLAQAKEERAYFAHPFAWAPFFLVGEGASTVTGNAGLEHSQESAANRPSPQQREE